MRVKGRGDGLVLRELPQGGGNRLEHARIKWRWEVDDGQSCTDLCQCGGLAGGRLGIPGESDVTGEEDLRRVAAEVLAVLMQDVAFAGELFRRATDEVPVLGEPGGRAQRPLLTAPADADRRMGAL